MPEPGSLALLALLLAAVQAAREAARRMQCTNNLKQIGLAMHSYHDAFRSFPIGSPRTADGFSWLTSILPYLAQKPLYDQLAPTGGVIPPPTKGTPIMTPLGVCRCPSDPGGANSLFCDGSVRLISENIETNPKMAAGNFSTNTPNAGNYVYQNLTNYDDDNAIPAGVF